MSRFLEEAMYVEMGQKIFSRGHEKSGIMVGKNRSNKSEDD